MGTTSRWLRHDVGYSTGTIAGGSVAISGARLLKDGRYVLAVYASGTGYVPIDAVTASSASSVTFDTTKIADGTPVMVVFHTDLTDQWEYTHEYPHVRSGYTPPPDQPVGVRGWGVEVYLVGSGVTGQKVLRAQTCTIQGQQQTTRVMELGNEEVVGYSDGIPDVTGTLEIMQHNFHLQELLAGDADASEDDYTPMELDGGDYGLLVKIWRRNADRVTTQPEKTVFLPKIEVTQAQNQSQVGQDARQTFNFASRTNECYMFKGDKPADFWGATGNEDVVSI